MPNCRRFIFTLAALLFCPLLHAAPVPFLTYDDFPPELQTILDERITEITTNGGACFAGRVQFNDATPIIDGNDLVVNIRNAAIFAPSVYEGGWFIYSRVVGSSFAGSGTVTARAIGFEGLDTSLNILDGEMTYTQTYIMNRVDPADESTISGVVRDGSGTPVNGASVRLGFSLPSSGPSPQDTIVTGPDGGFSFDGLSQVEHFLVASLTDYSFAFDFIAPPVSDTATWDPVLYPTRRTIINYVYQSDGTMQFSGPGLVEGRVDWLPTGLGFDFEDGAVEGYEPADLRDLELFQMEDRLQFFNTYVNGSNGFYDAGAVPLDSVTEAASSGYGTSRTDIIVGHVYVVRTLQEGHYAKLIVKADEPSFLPISPGDLDPADFSTYGLIIDVSASDGFGKMFVQLLVNGETVTGPSNSLPYLWQITEPESVDYTTDLVFEYTDDDLLNAGLDEGDITMARSTNGGLSWSLVDAVQDTTLNSFTLMDQNLVGQFIITKNDPIVRNYWAIF